MNVGNEPVTAALAALSVIRWEDGAFVSAADDVAAEAPLSVRIASGDAPLEPLVMTMRTPGADGALAVGYLHGEGLVRNSADLVDVEALGPDAVGVRLASGLPVDRDALRRGALQSSSCGVCGKVTAEDLRVIGAGPAPDDITSFAPDVLGALPAVLRSGQRLFAGTGGVHAVGVASGDGELLALAEDVGRHNAFDKLVGASILGHPGAPPLPWRGLVVVLSGRASYELVQKAIATGVPIVVSVGAPSSLAVRLAAAHGVTLVGFARPGRFNIYAHPERVRGASGEAS